MLQSENNSPETMEVPDIRKLKILYTSDIKGEAEKMVYLATVTREIRSGEPYSLLLDSGNWAKGTPLTDQFKGMPMVEILDSLGYDASGVGEGEIAFGLENLKELAKNASFPLVSLNLVESKTGQTPDYIEPFIIINKGPFKIAITGISRPCNYTEAGLVAGDPYTIMPEILNKIKENGPDLIIVLSRLGIERERSFAKAFPDVGLIIGGGDGINLEKPIMEGKTLICQAGEKASSLGSIDISMQMIINITPA